MDENHLTTEDLDNISALQAQKDAETHYTERPKSQRVLAWICIGIMLLMSLLTMPQMIAELFTIRLRPMMAISAAVSLTCSVLGLFCSYWIAVPASATIVLLLISAYILARIAKRFNPIRALGNAKQ